VQVFSQQLSPCVSNIYTHLIVIVALKVNEVANDSKGVEKKAGNTDIDKEIRGLKDTLQSPAVPWSQWC